MLFSSAATRSLVARYAKKSSPLIATAKRSVSALSQFEDYGRHVFTGKVADDYLSKHGASVEILKDPTWVNTHADKVANAVFEWYVLLVEKRYGCRVPFTEVYLSSLLTLFNSLLSFSFTLLLYTTGPLITAPMSTVIGSSRLVLVVFVSE